MTLKPRAALSIAMILGGCVLSVFGIGAWVHLGGFVGLIPGVFGLLGVLWIVVASLALARRHQMAIVVDERGIEMPAFPVFDREARRVFIPREDIATVSKHESMKGRLIEIATADGKKVLVQARHYCELDQFISHCERHGLPVG
jgi:hypothetical protein